MTEHDSGEPKHEAQPGQLPGTWTYDGGKWTRTAYGLTLGTRNVCASATEPDFVTSVVYEISGVTIDGHVVSIRGFAVNVILAQRAADHLAARLGLEVL